MKNRNQMQVQRIKVVVIGDSGSGKTSMVRQVLGKPPLNSSTLGVDVHPFAIGNTVLGIWDTGARFGGLGPGYYNGAQAAIIFQSNNIGISHWYQAFKAVCPNGLVVIVGKGPPISNFHLVHGLMYFDISNSSSQPFTYVANTLKNQETG
jgi:GTPase SAR1 family protein